MKIKYLLASLSIFFALSIFAVTRAAPSDNPVFATIDQVRQMISDAMQQQKALKVLDANGDELGLYMEGGRTSPQTFSVYLTALEKYVTIGESQGIIGRIVVYPEFESIDCTGQAYSGSNNPALFGDRLYSSGEGRYYYLKNGEVPITGVTIKSRLEPHGGSSYHCVLLSSSDYSTWYKLTEVSLPFSEPVVVPLQIKYQ